MTDAYEIVEQRWPFDGPHSDDTVHSAAMAARQLVRYMANATYRPVGSGPALWRIVSALREAVVGLEQVLRQLAESASGAVADDASLFDDRHDRPGADTASEVAILLRHARGTLMETATALSLASAAASHLGHDTLTAEAVRRG